MKTPVRWCAIADEARSSEKRRFESLSQALREAGIENEFEFLIADKASAAAVLDKAKSEFAQIRLAGSVGAWILPTLERVPSSLNFSRAADAMVCEYNEWWPRFYLVEGLNQMLSLDASTLDLSGSVFIFGATPEARAAAAALSKIGLNRVVLSDPDDAKASAFVEELKRADFGTQFQAVPRAQITQIPGICSVAINTLSTLSEKETATELAYFNFLKPGGFWLDLAIFPLNATLQTEAQSVGASLFSGAHALALTDRLWAEAAFKVSIDAEAHSGRLTN